MSHGLTANRSRGKRNAHRLARRVLVGQNLDAAAGLGNKVVDKPRPSPAGAEWMYGTAQLRVTGVLIVNDDDQEALLDQ